MLYSISPNTPCGFFLQENIRFLKKSIDCHGNQSSSWNLILLTHLVELHARNISAKVQQIWPNKQQHFVLNIIVLAITTLKDTANCINLIHKVYIPKHYFTLNI